MADDHAAHAIGAYGSAINATPGIDRLATEGMRFDACFCTNSICSPSRASILTGTYSHVNGVTTLDTPFDARQPAFPGAAARRRLPDRADREVAPRPRRHPRPGRLRLLDGAARPGRLPRPDVPRARRAHRRPARIRDRRHHRPRARLDRRPRPGPPVPGAGPPQGAAPPVGAGASATPTLYDDARDPGAADAARRLRRPLDRRGRGADAPRRDLTDEDLKAAGPVRPDATDEELRWRYQRYIKDYLRCVAAVDENVGRLLDFLDERGLADDTVVVYTSDQGFFLGDHGWFDKRFMYEESLRMPLLVRYPPEVAAGHQQRRHRPQRRLRADLPRPRRRRADATDAGPLAAAAPARRARRTTGGRACTTATGCTSTARTASGPTAASAPTATSSSTTTARRSTSPARATSRGRRSGSCSTSWPTRSSCTASHDDPAHAGLLADLRAELERLSDEVGDAAPLRSRAGRRRASMTTTRARADWEARIGLRSDAEAGARAAARSTAPAGLRATRGSRPGDPGLGAGRGRGRLRHRARAGAGRAVGAARDRRARGAARPPPALHRHRRHARREAHYRVAAAASVKDFDQPRSSVVSRHPGDRRRRRRSGIGVDASTVHRPRPSAMAADDRRRAPQPARGRDRPRRPADRRRVRRGAAPGARRARRRGGAGARHPQRRPRHVPRGRRAAGPRLQRDRPHLRPRARSSACARSSS